jgi:hypothetical protein
MTTKKTKQDFASLDKLEKEGKKNQVLPQNDDIPDELIDDDDCEDEEFDDEESSEEELQKKPEVDYSPKKEAKTLIDGYKLLDRELLQLDGALYPNTWQFAYRCPTSKEIANFSAIDENDKPAIIAAVEDLIRKCVAIFDVDTKKAISSGQINDCNRTFFLLLLREFFIPNNPITYETLCSFCHEEVTVNLTSSSLIYKVLNDKLLNAFDGRRFTLEFPELKTPIVFCIPTLEITGKIFKHIYKVYNENKTDRESKAKNKVVYDKQFLMLAPFLYERGDEKIEEIISRFKKLQEDDERLKKYVEVIAKLKLDNEEYIESPCADCGNVEEPLIRFPKGFKKLFIADEDASGYFD